ncbi:MAG: hypothetical protein RMJ60_00950 [Anaerolineales bacterium]|nr:hypothetical protein [Anaerolineales bacterium]
MPSPELPTSLPVTNTAEPLPTATSLPPTATTPSNPQAPQITPGTPSGPYAVILVAPNDVLNIRSGPGVSNRIVATFAPTAKNVMRTGPSAVVSDGAKWVEVRRPDGGVGWVNFYYLTEYVAPDAFCADTRVNDLISRLGNALLSRNGVQLSGLVSPRHGMTVYLWRYSGRSVTFMPNDARWVFDSTYEHNWGMEPASGLTTTGSFQNVVLPKLQDVFSASYTLTCNALGDAPQYGTDPWPVIYGNVNYYTILKPGTPGVDVDFRFWLMGVEYVNGQPYVFALIHFQWEP